MDINASPLSVPMKFVLNCCAKINQGNSGGVTPNTAL